MATNKRTFFELKKFFLKKFNIEIFQPQSFAIFVAADRKKNSSLRQMLEANYSGNAMANTFLK